MSSGKNSNNLPNKISNKLKICPKTIFWFKQATTFETLDLLKQDLSRADARITSKQKELNDAQTKVKEAELALADIMKLRESTPQVLKEKEEALAVARTKLDGKQKEYAVFKSKVDQQKEKTEALLKNYLDALPKE